jgi:hypothetical protein
MTAWMIALQILGGIFFICAVMAVITLRDLGWRRYIPLATVAAWKLTFLASFLHIRILNIFCSVACPLLTFVLIIYTLRTTWSGKNLVERILRIICVIYLILIARFFLFSGIP